ncbi:hypothetical protein OAH18_03095, partial [bacterium]|nr:hypothetical protein [bacterium]
ETIEVQLVEITAGNSSLLIDDNSNDAAIRILDSTNFSTDVDGDGHCQPLTDGILLVRYLAGFQGAPLVADAINEADGTRVTSDDVIGWLEPHTATFLDVDGSGEAFALSDGLLFLRYLAGFRGDTLINNTVAANATRNTSEQIVSFLDDFSCGQQAGPIAGPVPSITWPLTADSSRRDSQPQIQTTNIANHRLNGWQTHPQTTHDIQSDVAVKRVGDQTGQRTSNWSANRQNDDTTYFDELFSNTDPFSLFDELNVTNQDGL